MLVAAAGLGRGLGDQRQGGIDQRHQPVAARFRQRLQAWRLPGGNQALGGGGRVVETLRGEARFDRFPVVGIGTGVAGGRVDVVAIAVGFVGKHFIELAGDEVAVRFQLD